MLNILIEGPNLEHYYAKVHISWRKGWSRMFGARCYGKGYDTYSENIKTFPR